MLDKDIEKLIEDASEQEQRPAKGRSHHDEVHEASDESFPASDPPAYTSAPPRKRTRYARKDEENKD